jgi:hypothetical protein
VSAPAALLPERSAAVLPKNPPVMAALTEQSAVGRLPLAQTQMAASLALPETAQAVLACPVSLA